MFISSLIAIRMKCGNFKQEKVFDVGRILFQVDKLNLLRLKKQVETKRTGMVQTTEATTMAANPISIPRREWTFEDLESFADDVRRELDDNTFFEMPSPTLKHQDIVLSLAFFLRQWATQHGGKAFLSPVDLVISPKRVFIPDLCFYGREKMATGEVERDPKRLRVAPDLVVEILSPSTASRDRVLKFRRYAEFGVRFYWIIDPRDRVLQAFQLEGGRYRDEAVLGENDAFSPSLFPGLTLQVGELLGADQSEFPPTGE